MCQQYLLTDGNISKWKKVSLSSNVISEFYEKMCNNSIDIAPDISEMVSNNFWELVQCDVPQEDNTSSKTKPLDHKCDKCGSPMYANMKFGVVELECETCGNYREI